MSSFWGSFHHWLQQKFQWYIPKYVTDDNLSLVQNTGFKIMFWQLLLEHMLTNIFRTFWSITRWQWVQNNKIIVAIVTDKSTLQLMDEGTISGPKLGYCGKVTRTIIHLAVRCLFVRFGAILPTSDTCCHCLPPGLLYVMAISCSKWWRFYFCEWVSKHPTHFQNFNWCHDHDCIFYI